MARGDHIYVNRGLYTHHGIDAGDGSVIHFSGEPKVKRDASIKRATLDEFLQGGELKVRRYGSRSNADATMRRAMSRIGSTRYHLVINNCEHFAVWCCTGKHVSRQVRGVGSLTAHGAVATSTFGATTGVVATVGTVSGLSGPGIMSALSTAGALVGGTAAAGPAVLGALPALTSVGITQVALRDDETLPAVDRRARRDGRVTSVAAAGAGTFGGVAVISAAGTTGLSAAGISSGLAAIGSTVGGGMVAGTAVVAAAPAVLAAGVGTGVYLMSKRFRDRRATKDEQAGRRPKLRLLVSVNEVESGPDGQVEAV